MTVTFGVDGNNDLVVVGRSLAVVSDLEAVLQICAQCAKAILGEMVLNVQGGMPYFQTVWVGGPTTAAFEAAFRLRIPQVEGVSEIQELTTAQVGENMQYSATIATVYGTGAING